MHPGFSGLGLRVRGLGFLLVADLVVGTQRGKTTGVLPSE